MASKLIDQIRTTVGPIRREGWPFVGILLVAALGLGWFWQPLFWIGLLLAGWCAYFFRDPARVIPVDDALVVSPADGRVSSVASGQPPPELGLAGDYRRVSIFMNLFDCHVNRAPLAGAVERIVYKPGRFLNADLDKASQENERSGMVLATGHGAEAVVQIAGLIARRIVCFVGEGDRLAAGERIGLIRFGSRVDVYLPRDAGIVVAKGQIAVAGETVIARFGIDSTDPRVRID